MLPHQDWSRVVLSGPSTTGRKGAKAASEAHRKGQEVETIRRPGGNPAARSGLPTNMRRLAEETDVVPMQTIPHEFKVAMQQARAAASLSQQDLARRVNEKQSVINDYESGRAIPNGAVITKIERALNCHLPRPAKLPRKTSDD
jgi:putative transcription factor